MEGEKNGIGSLAEVMGKLKTYDSEPAHSVDNTLKPEEGPDFLPGYPQFLMKMYVREHIHDTVSSEAKLDHFDILQIDEDDSQQKAFLKKLDQAEQSELEHVDEGIIEYSWTNFMRKSIFDAIKKSPKDSQADLFRTFVTLLSQYGCGDDDIDMREALTNYLTQHPDHEIRIDGYAALIEAIVDHVDNPNAFSFKKNDDYEDTETMELDSLEEGDNQDEDPRADDFTENLMDEFSIFSSNYEPVLEALSRFDSRTANLFLAHFPALHWHYGEMIQAMRTVTGNTPPSEARDRMEQLGKRLIGFAEDDPRPFHVLLSDVYKSVDLTRYEAYNSTEATDIRLITDLAAEVGGGTIVDIGCNTGRLMHTLAQSDVAAQTGLKIVGIDIDEDGIRQAQKAGTELNLENVSYHEGSFLGMRSILEPGSVSAMYSLGRTVNHVEGTYEFQQLARQVHTVLGKDGVWLFDTPNSGRGNVQANRTHIAETVAGFKAFEVAGDVRGSGRNMEAVQARSVDYVVDSPDGQNFFTRYVPQIQDLLQQLRMCGFDAEVVTTAPLQGPSYAPEDQTVYIRAVKQEEPMPLSRQLEPKTIEQMLSESFPDGVLPPQ